MVLSRLLLFGLLPGALWSSPARADEAEVQSCVRAKVHEAFGEGWSVRTSTTASLKHAETDVYAITMQAGNNYKLMACADAGITDVGLFLYDAEGKLLQSDPSKDREPVLQFTATSSGRYFVVVQAAAMAAGTPQGSVATAVVFK